MVFLFVCEVDFVGGVVVSVGGEVVLVCGSVIFVVGVSLDALCVGVLL